MKGIMVVAITIEIEELSLLLSPSSESYSTISIEPLHFRSRRHDYHRVPFLDLIAIGHCTEVVADRL